jgi:predicted DNA-binding transcriptional regulator AlpA
MVTSTVLDGLRELARALPPGTAIPVPRELLLELLVDAPAPAPTATSANGAGTPDEQLLTVQEVADRFGLTPDWIYRHWQAVGGVKLGRKVLRFPASALPRYLASQRKAP